MRIFCNNQHSKNSRDGFVLVMALGLILIAGLILAGVARQSLALATEVAHAQEELQRRWGAISTQRLLLPHAEEVLEGLATPVDPKYPPRWPLPARLEGEFSLGKLLFQVELVDEETKIDLNKLYYRDQQKLNRVVNDQLFNKGSYSLSKQLLIQPSSTRQRQPVLFYSWGQVFRIPEDLSPDQTAHEIRAVTSGVTLWGSGRLNIRRADDETIRQQAEQELPAQLIDQIIFARAEPGITKLDEVLEQVDLKGIERSTARQLFSDQSQSHALWIRVQSSRQTWTQLTLDQASAETGADSQTFSW
ncbi:MAG: hypothetical protein KDA65_10865 [Planctomycetaceae bacterium]|nr:hypothetical protein [Planctomycetaceae bacterium]